jgi:hypothetical protein
MSRDPKMARSSKRASHLKGRHAKSLACLVVGKDMASGLPGKGATSLDVPFLRGHGCIGRLHAKKFLL